MVGGLEPGMASCLAWRRESPSLRAMSVWYYSLEGRREGPVGVDEMRAMLASGMLRADTLVWREGMSGWQPVMRTPEWAAELMHPGAAYSPYALPPMNGMAVASLCCGIGSLLLLMTCGIGALASVPGVICGHMALRQIRTYILPMRGHGLAVGGLVTSYLTLGLTLAGIIFFVVTVMIAGNP